MQKIGPIMELEQFGWVPKPTKPRKLGLQSVLFTFSKGNRSDDNESDGDKKDQNSKKAGPFCPKKNKTTSLTQSAGPPGVKTYTEPNMETLIFETKSSYNFERQTVDPIDYSYNLRITGYSMLFF